VSRKKFAVKRNEPGKLNQLNELNKLISQSTKSPNRFILFRGQIPFLTIGMDAIGFAGLVVYLSPFVDPGQYAPS
jgi:hypothetical protein